MADIFKDILPAIMRTKKADVLENEKDYNAFVVNRALSFHSDCVFQANQMNMNHQLDNKLQFHYLLNTIRGYKRPFQEWQKRETVADIDVVKEYYGYSNDKAKEALTVLSDDQINEIRKKLDKGGLNARTKRTGGGNTT